VARGAHVWVRVRQRGPRGSPGRRTWPRAHRTGKGGKGMLGRGIVWGRDAGSGEDSHNG